MFISGLLPLLYSSEGVDVGDLRAVHGARARWSTRRAARASRSSPRTCTHAAEGAFTGEVSRADARPSSTSTASCSATPSGASCSARPTRRSREKVPAALAAGLLPILCVGETESEREAGETERKLRHQVQHDLAKVPRERLGEVVIAYEPIWAIGTGKVATAEQAQEACAFVRALVADIDAEAGAAVRIQYGGSVKPDNAAELLALPDVDGALVGGASLDPKSFAQIVEAARA